MRQFLSAAVAAPLALGMVRGVQLAPKTFLSASDGAAVAQRRPPTRAGSAAPATLLQQDRGKADDPKSAAFFNDYSEGESNYDPEFDPSVQSRSTGFESKLPDGDKGKAVLPAEWYHESASGGPRQAWQTHYPSLSTGVAGRDGNVGHWRIDGSGHWVEDPGNKQAESAGVRSPEWFEASVDQYDGFGRPLAPLPGSSRRMLQSGTWAARSVNTTLTCSAPGCAAEASIQAFDSGVERATHCKLSVFFHPTDFDDSYSGERVTFIKVNGYTASSDCYPMVSGCNETTQRPMFSCLRDMPVDHLVNSSGVLQISAAISDVVDECPYEGNLLSAVPMVTCLVAPIPEEPVPVLQAAQPVKPSVPKAEPKPTSVFLSAPFRCPERGCRARAELFLNQSSDLALEQCLLTVKVNQTDFDGDQGTEEKIEYVKLNDGVLASDLKPGANPCRSVWAGKPLTLAQQEFTAVSQQDVTQNVTASEGHLRLEVKISDFVDECAHEGYLLSGTVGVLCKYGALEPVKNGTGVVSRLV